MTDRTGGPLCGGGGVGNARAGRAGSTTPVFDRFVGACRAAITELEKGTDQVVL
ncbi:hypothetical protein [Streptomyces sp. NPDC088180]|uniref:hypothetical protein n=1 Tax=Streptomyces sp. NPDC088180 TaxID=3365837 RepID=UPI0037F7FD40